MKVASMNKRRAFTLVELVVTIGIIVFLAGLTVTAATKLVKQSEIRQTRNSITLLDRTVREWELATDRKLSRGLAEGRDDIWQLRSFTLVITELLDTVRRAPAAREQLERIDPDFVHRYVDGPAPEWITLDQTGQGGAASQLQRFIDRDGITILDAWGVPIYATHPGQLATIPANADPDGTISTYNELYFGAARNRQICFVSAGPDRSFGNLHLEKSPEHYTAQDRADVREAQDNIYSYEIERRK